MAGNMIEVARATVTIIPNMDGAQKKISQGLTSAAGPAGTSAGNAAGESLGKSLLGVVSKVVTAAAIGKIFKDAIGAGAALQQSLGGVETLFRENADIVVKNAEKAYQTAGVSANDYMEQVTGFSATLLQGLGGDTKKAAKYADQAIVDMADNANKMGTSVEMIQNAYQGFAKDNYTMLDNLKLGGHASLAEYKPRENGETLMLAA